LIVFTLSSAIVDLIVGGLLFDPDDICDEVGET
jgi:hypothetical protein